MNFSWIQNADCSTKIRNLYKTKNKKDICDMVYLDLVKNFKRKYREKGYIYFETVEHRLYKFCKNKLINIINTEPKSDIDIIKNIQNSKMIIPTSILNKFTNTNNDKLLEIIQLYVDKCNIIKRTLERIYLENVLSEVILIIDYSNFMIEDIVTSKLEPISDSRLVIENDKIIYQKTSMLEDTNINKMDILNQIPLLESYNYNLQHYIVDIRENFQELIVSNASNNTFDIRTLKYIYTIKNYNIISIKNINGLPIPTDKKKQITNNMVFSTELLNNLTDGLIDIKNEYKTNILLKDLFGDYIKAKEYIYKLGLSIRVITKFVLNNNLRELYEYLTNDIIYYGQIIYDDYIENEMIIKTNRYYYILVNNVISTIKDINENDIEECSIQFKPYSKNISKENILDLDITDKIRTFIPYNQIKNLQINCHAKERFNERISKNDNILDKENILKNDIYKYGEVILGTYYINTKLIKGLKNVYVLNNQEIISVWKINDFISNLNNRYFSQIDISN